MEYDISGMIGSILIYLWYDWKRPYISLVWLEASLYISGMIGSILICLWCDWKYPKISSIRFQTFSDYILLLRFILGIWFRSHARQVTISKGDFFMKNPLNMVFQWSASITYDLTTWCFLVARHGAIHKHLNDHLVASYFAPNTVFLNASVTDRRTDRFGIPISPSTMC